VIRETKWDNPVAGDESWDQMVPPQVAEIIRRRGFFGYKKR
jgi:hypothetical protein